MKVIDLLNKIANGEEVPHFKVSEIEYYLNWRGDLLEREEGKPSADAQWFIDKDWLNTEVEIIEGEKNIRNLDFVEENTFSKRQNGMTSEDRRLLDSNFKELGNKINEIIDYLNKEK